jgi:hypothetical protein
MSYKESFGFQLENSALYNSTEKDEINSLSQTKYVTAEKTRITTGGVFGYNRRENNFEFGAVVTTGSYGFENQKYEVTSSISGYHENEVSNYYIHDDGFGLMLGLCLRPAYKLRVSLEGGYIIPFSFNEKSWNDETFMESTSEIRVVYTALVRSGVNYRYNRFIGLGFGGSFITYKAESSGDASVQTGSTSLYVYQIISGIDIKPSKDYTLLFGLSFKRSGIISDFSTPGKSFELRIVKNSVEAMCGISCNL